MFYILNRSGQIIVSSNLPMNVEELASRGETQVASELNLHPAQLEVVGFPEKPSVIEMKNPISAPKMVLTTTAKDSDGDGLPELAADGESRAEIAVILLDAEGNAIAKPTEVQFRTTAGALSRRRVATRHGKATVQLTASRETVVTSVLAFAEGFEPVTLVLEFVPPEE